MNTEVMFSSKTDLWATPQSFFDQMDSEFNFNLDTCAIPENAKCERYFTPEVDGLLQDWGGEYRMVQPAVWQGDRQVG